MSDICRAARAAIRKSQFSVEEVAVHLGVSMGVLNNKLNPLRDSNKLSAEEWVEIQDFTAVIEPLRMVAHDFGYNLVERNASPAACLKSLSMLLTAELGDLVRELHDAQKDGAIDLNELDRIKSKAQQVIASIESIKATASHQASADVVSLVPGS